MNGVDIVSVLLGAVAGVAHIADHIPGSYHAALLQIKGIGKILPQMGVIIIALLIKAADADPPASVPVPAKSLHIAGFNGGYGGSDLPHHIMAKVGSFVAIASGGTKIVIIAVVKSFGNGRKGFQPVNLFPCLSAGIIHLLDLIFSHHPAKNSFISFQIIRIIGKLLCQLI